MVTEKITMSMCVKDINALLTKAMQDHVLKNGHYDVMEVFWDGHDMSFRITLEPKKNNAILQRIEPGAKFGSQD